MRGIVVGKLLVDFQSGGQLAGRRNLLVRRHWLAAGHWSFSRRRNGIHVEHAGTALGEAAFQLSHRSSTCAAVGPAENRLRPARSGVTGGDRRGTIRRLAVFARRLQYELCLSRSSLSSLLGTRSRAPHGDFCGSRRAPLLADSPPLELAVSGSGRD